MAGIVLGDGEHSYLQRTQWQKAFSIGYESKAVIIHYRATLETPAQLILYVENTWEKMAVDAIKVSEVQDSLDGWYRGKQWIEETWHGDDSVTDDIGLVGD